MKRSLFALGCLLSLAACHSQTKQTTAPELAGQASQTASGQTSISDSPGTAYRVYRASLPGQRDSITLHLVAAPRNFGSAAVGYYGSYYGADGHPYSLQSQPSATPDSVVLFDTSPEKAAASTSSNSYWRLRRQPGRGNLAGTVGGRPVQLRLVAPAVGTLHFAVRYFTDSAAAFPKEPASPKGRISVQALVPVAGSAATRQTLEANMLRGLRGDTLEGLPPIALPTLCQQQRQEFFTAYREDAAASRPAPADTAGVGDYGIGLNYENQTATYVLYHQENLLSLGYFTFDYSGGAHGNYGTTGASYDLRTGRRLRYTDIFLPTAEAHLAALLGQAVRPLVGLAPSAPLDQQLLVSKMPVTRNVFLTAGGAVFIYQPYEIAAYAQGEVRIFVPLSELRPLLREGLPLPTSSVAAR